MRRELLIIFGVLVPFALLVAAALWWTSTSTSTSAPVPPATHEVRVTPLAPEPPPRDAGPGAIDAGAPLSGTVPVELEAPLAAVRAEVHRCFADQKARMRSPVKVTMRFTPTRDGGFERVVVEKTSWEDPYLRACLEDVFAELGFTPTGRETFAPATFTFDFDPSRD